MGDDTDEGEHGITFGTDGWRATLSEFTTDRVRMVGQAVASFLDDHDVEGAVAIGYDARDHSRQFADELADVVSATGPDVTISDRDCPTPTLAWTVARGGYAGGLVVTASHNPPNYNGVKFVPASGEPALPEITDELERRLAAPESSASGGGDVRERDIVEPYVDHVLSFPDDEFGVGIDLDGLPVAYDAMHGSGRDVTDVVLERAGTTVTRLRCERDVEFGGTAPEPVPKNASTLIETVAGGDATLGIINDGDADRIGIVTPERGFLDPNVVLAVVYDFLLEYATGDAVRTVSTSSLVDRVAGDHGMAVHETPVGFKWVAAAMAEHGALAGGEESGGYGVAAHLRNKDGVLLALLVAAAHSEELIDARIDTLFDEYGEIHQDRISLDCPDDHKESVLSALENELPDEFAGESVASVTTVDGFKLTLEDGTWVLVRPSGTEPKLRVYAEATSETRVRELLEDGREFVQPVVDDV